jgi:hypothetical protein
MEGDLDVDGVAVLNELYLENAPAACSLDNSFMTRFEGNSSTCVSINDSVLDVNSSDYWDGLDSPDDFSNIELSGSINQTIADGTTRYFSNGCYEKVNSTGVYWIC